MSNGVFARLISKLRAPKSAVADDDLGGDACESENSDRHDAHLFSDMLAASVVLDFGGAPADFFQMRRRDFLDSAAGRAGSK